jgi:hypothetical protein
MFTHGIVITQAQGGGGGGQPGPNSPGAPAIPDGVWPMGYQGYVKGVRQDLVDLNRDWNFTTDGLDLSGFRIHGKVVCRSNGITGDGFEIVGAPGGTTANALLDCNTHFTGTPPTFSNFTINPDVPVKGTNGFMGDEATLFNFDIGYVGGDALSPNNLDNGLRPLNFSADWGYCHDLVYYLIDQANGTHNDGCQVPGGTNITLTRIRMTGITSPTLGDGAALRTVGPNDGSGPRTLGQQNSSVITTQNVSHVGAMTIDSCHIGGGWFGTINLQSVGSSTQLGPIIVTNNIFDGNDWDGYDLIIHSNSDVTQSGNTRVDGKPLSILHSSTPS